MLGAYVGGSYFFGFSVFFDPIQSEFEWTRAATALAFSFASLETAFAGPILGPLVDRFGSRRVMLFGVIVVGLAFVNLGFVNSLPTFYLAYFILALGASSVTGVAPMAAITRWFRRRRSVALGLLTGGFAVGGGVMVPVLGWLIANLRWRVTTRVVAAGIWGVGVPLLLVVRNRPEPYGYLPDGEAPEPPTRTSPAPEARSPTSSLPIETSIPLRSALTSSSWWLVAVSFALRAFSVSAVVAHVIPLLIDRGFDSQTAANLAGTMALLSLPGRLIFGYLGDLYSKKLLLLLTFVLHASALGLLIIVTDIWQVYLFCVVIGLGWGAVPLFFGLYAEYFGPAAFASIVGFSQAVQQLGTASGPVFAGWVFDTRGSYALALVTFILATALGAASILIVRHPARTIPRPAVSQKPTDG